MPNIFINSCKECNGLNIGRTPTSDSFDVAFDWFCSQEKNKKIAGYIGPFDKIPNVPKWCPKIKKRKNI